MNRIFLAFMILLTSCANNNESLQDIPEPATKEDAQLHDNHVHIMSPELIALWKDMGIPFSNEDDYYSNIDTIMETTGAGSISLISMAYVYTSDEFGGNAENTTEKIRSENDYLAKAKDSYPNKIKTYYGIDPLHSGALDEIKRCHQELKLDGIKLHHNASQVYLTEPEHLVHIRKVFQYASENEIPILLHFDNGHPRFGKEDVQILADSILANLDYVDLQIAHFGTSGGFNQKTKDVLDSFIDLFQSNHVISKQKITFDISAVCLDQDTEGLSRLSESEFSELGVYCRKLGFDRIVFGTDYPLYSSTAYLELLTTKLNLNSEEIDELLKEK